VVDALALLQWSFAVTLWELFTFADRPYSEVIESSSVVDYVVNGRRLPQPNNCPSQL